MYNYFKDIYNDDVEKEKGKKIMNKKQITLEEQLREIGLDIPENWKGDIRDQLILLFAPLLEESEYEIKKNVGDSTKYVLDLFYKGAPRRSMGFGIMKGMNFKIFPVRSFYEELLKKYPLPEPDLKKSQPHIKLTLKQMWDVMECIGTKMKE